MAPMALIPNARRVQLSTKLMTNPELRAMQCLLINESRLGLNLNDRNFCTIIEDFAEMSTILMRRESNRIIKIVIIIDRND